MGLGDRGMTIIELIVVMLMFAVVATVALPRAVKSSPRQQVDLAARALMRDLEQVRMRALSAKRVVRVRFDESNDFYTAFMDVTPDRQGTLGETAQEVEESGLLIRGSSGGLKGVELPKGVRFAVGAATVGPGGLAVVDPVSLTNDRVDFDGRGMVTPAGAGGTVLITHDDDPTAVAAVTISGASAFRTWRLQGGQWIR